MSKKSLTVRVDEEILERMRQITEENPKINQALLVDVALEYVTSLSKEDRIRAIAEYYQKGGSGKGDGKKKRS